MIPISYFDSSHRMNILVIRFRQMGDAILSTVVLNALRRMFPDATIDFVLNENLCPLFEGHPAIDRIIPFSYDERHSLWRYLRKVWQTVRRGRYDVIIDMRSTPNTLPFVLFSLRSRFRVGLRKPHALSFYNHTVEPCRSDQNIIDHNLSFLRPLESITPIPRDATFSLHISDEEQALYQAYLRAEGVDLQRPILLVGVTGKLLSKTWDEDRMTEVLRRMIQTWPNFQFIFNYAPGREKENALRVYEQLGRPKNVFIQVEARSQRELVALCSAATMYFGNEGGARHVVHACGKPSFVVFAPNISKAKWLPQNDIPTEGITAWELGATPDMTNSEAYACITPDAVWERLQKFMDKNVDLGM